MAKKKKIVHKGLEFDSNEEVWFFEWLLNAQELGLVFGFDYHPATWKLCDKVPITRTSYKLLKNPPFLKKHTRDVQLIQEYVYTPDFKILFSPEMRVYYPDAFMYHSGDDVIVDVKGNWSRGTSSGITFGVKRAWLYATQGVYVEKTKPRELFAKTWVPEFCRYTRVRKQLVKEYTKDKYKTMEQAKEYQQWLREKLQPTTV